MRLHPLGQRVARPLEAGQVGEHELEVVAVRDPEDAPPRGLRLVGDDRDLAPAERVDERGLADVGPPGDGDEADLHWAGPTCRAAAPPGVVRRRARRRRSGNVTRSTRNSTSHWRQPPHGDAVIAIASRSPGRQPATTAARDRPSSRRRPRADRRRSRRSRPRTRARRARARAAPTRYSEYGAYARAATPPPARRARVASREELEEDEGHERAERAAVRRPRASSGRPTRRASGRRARAMIERRAPRRGTGARVGPSVASPPSSRRTRPRRGPDGSPPRSGVPRPVNAFVAITTRIVDDERDQRQVDGASRTRSMHVRAGLAGLAGEDEVADRDRVHRRDQHGAGGDVLRELRERVERASWRRRSPARSPSSSSPRSARTRSPAAARSARAGRRRPRARRRARRPRPRSGCAGSAACAGRGSRPPARS